MMSCCSGCESGMSGCCGSHSYYPLMGMLMGELLTSGSQARVGFAYNYESTAAGVEAEKQGAGWLQRAILGQLQSAGVYSAVNVTVQPPQYGNFQDGYITVQVTLGDAQSDINGIGDAVQYAIQAYAPGVSISYRDNVVVDYVAPGSQIQPQQQPQQIPQPQGQSGQCNWSQQSFGDYLACQLGITSPIGGVGVGAIGALVGVGVLTLIAVVALKR